jgi:large repetitive protein
MKKILLILFFSQFIVAIAQQNINMPNGTGSATYTTCNANFYDAGGAAGNHGLYQATNIKFSPTTPGMAVKIQFNNFILAEGASLAIYDGPDNSYSIIGIYDQYINPTGLAIVATPANPDGSLYIQFTSGATNAAGWSASVTCRAPCQSFNIQLDPLVTTKPIVEEFT